MDIDYLILILILLAICMICYNKYEFLSNEVIYVKSNIDNKEYLVRNLEDKQEAADLLATIRNKLEKLVSQLYEENKDKDEYIRLYEKFNPEHLSETGKNNKYTSYSVNKGEKIVLCLRQKNEKEELVKENLLLFVALHELAHIMTKSIGHTQEFWDNFKILLKQAIDKGIYYHEDYQKKPENYCGIKVTDTPLN